MGGAWQPLLTEERMSPPGEEEEEEKEEEEDGKEGEHNMGKQTTP